MGSMNLDRKIYNNLQSHHIQTYVSYVYRTQLVVRNEAKRRRCRLSTKITPRKFCSRHSVQVKSQLEF